MGKDDNAQIQKLKKKNILTSIVHKLLTLGMVISRYTKVYWRLKNKPIET